MMAVLRVVTLVFAALIAEASSLFAQSDPMAKWKPNIGDIFTYVWISHQVDYWHGSPTHTDDQRDTVRMEIVNTDTSLNIDHQHVVAVNTTWSGPYIPTQTAVAYYYFHPGTNLNSAHAFVIDEGIDNPNSYDFSLARDSQINFQSRALPAFVFRFDTVVNHGGVLGHASKEAVYSTQLHWFYSTGDSTAEPPPNLDYTEADRSMSLLLASSLSSGVPESSGNGRIDLIFEPNSGFLNLTLPASASTEHSFALLDMLGRPVRSWQMLAQPGGRKMTLNVADVPSAVYFLRVSGGGVSQLNKVAIVH